MVASRLKTLVIAEERLTGRVLGDQPPCYDGQTVKDVVKQMIEDQEIDPTVRVKIDAIRDGEWLVTPQRGRIQFRVKIS